MFVELTNTRLGYLFSKLVSRTCLEFAGDFVRLRMIPVGFQNI